MCVLSLLCDAALCVLYLAEEERAGCFTLIVFLFYVCVYKSLPRVTKNMYVHLLAILTCFSSIYELYNCAKHSSKVNQWINAVQIHKINQIHASQYVN